MGGGDPRKSVDDSTKCVIYMGRDSRQYQVVPPALNTHSGGGGGGGWVGGWGCSAMSTRALEQRTNFSRRFYIGSGGTRF